MIMTRLLVGTSAILMLFACTQPENAQPDSRKAVGLANPASEYCVKLGGRVEILKHANGDEYGMCHLKDGTSIEEWKLFRRDHKQ